MDYNLTHAVARHRDIGYLRLSRSDGGTKPVVIVLHGLDSSKERWLTTMYIIAQAGFDVVAPDLYLHGDRPDASTRDQRYETDYLQTVAEIVYQTLDDIPHLCEELKINPATSGLLGISAGGMITHAQAIQEPKFKAIVAAIASPNWMKIDPRYTPDPVSPEGMLLAATSPSNQPANYLPVALCMLVGELDERILPIGAVEMYDQLLPMYRQLGIEERLSLTVYPGVGHYYTDGMALASVEWFKKFLL